ncbi:uncharacterized protein [Blastocystis hominis]|uniref:Uncharacterized protein n=1 Tax=Blastocystis hominis TaxID=12968 RepID=D8LW95_BLAHO|nr:uncharacterized protein [Blastocystis hominis]CBK20084.2 unnamed protein product [Blastocystis hominis]|eukprot:XP_012894132.1 uncharacterized protein [Blastocystis hominis]
MGATAKPTNAIKSASGISCTSLRSLYRVSQG